jgi:serine/threonine protein kinase
MDPGIEEPFELQPNKGFFDFMIVGKIVKDVYVASARGRKVAVKLCWSVSEWRRELSALSNLSAADHIIRMHSYSRNSYPRWIAFYNYWGDDLATFLDRYARLGIFPPAPAVQILVRDVLIALRSVHEMGFAHLGIHPDNILSPYVNDHPRAILADFGAARRCRTNYDWDACRFSRVYSAPELFEDPPVITPAADIWSLAVLMHYLVTFAFPFPEDRPITIDDVESDNSRRQIRENLKRERVCQMTIDAIMRMLRYEPEKRPTAEDLFSLQFFNFEDLEYDPLIVSDLKIVTSGSDPSDEYESRPFL